MNIVFEAEKISYDIYINVPLLLDEYKLIINGLYSNDILLEINLTTILTNERYTHFRFSLTDELDLRNDIGGIYEYFIQDIDGIIDSGLIKVINRENELSTKSYTSSNEKRKAKVLYRPKK